MAKPRNLPLLASKAASLALIAVAPVYAQSGLYIPSAIVPGEFIGHARLNASVDQATKSFGPPTATDAAPPIFSAVWQSAGGRAVTILWEQNPNGGATAIREIRVSSSYFETREGIGPHSTLSAVESVFPGAKAVKHTPNTPYAGSIALLDDSAEGIAFEFPVKSGRLSPGARCTAVTIYPKNKSILNPSYPLYAAGANGALQYNAPAVKS